MFSYSVYKYSAAVLTTHIFMKTSARNTKFQSVVSVTENEIKMNRFLLKNIFPRDNYMYNDNNLLHSCCKKSSLELFYTIITK